MTPSRKKNRNNFKPLAIAALMAGTLMQPFMPSASAQVVGAGDSISNTATATYEDDDGNTFDTESNTVVVTVAEIAGLTVEPNTVNDQNGGSFEANDILDFSFTVTNVGNDTTDVQLPGLDDLITENFTPTQVEVFDKDGTSLGTYTSNDPILVIGDGDGDNTDGDLDAASDVLEAGEFLTVVVTGTVASSGLNPGDDISVTLGNTGANDNTPSTQNQPADTNDSNVVTVDLPAALDEVGGSSPTNGEREASAVQSADFATEQRPLALITVEKASSNIDPGATGAANDDVITYDLSLTVENSSPSGSFLPEDLDKTPIMLDQGGGVAQTDAVLVSDAIPEFTTFTGTASAPNANWTIVYSIDDSATTSPVVATGATAAQWSTTAPTDLSTVTRIGFVYLGAAALPANGTAITGYQFEVISNGLPAAGGNLYNLAQAFGTTYDDPAEANDPVDQIIYDESGDSNPNNFNDDSTPPTETDGGTPDGSNYDPIEDTGVADPTNHGTDDGSNTGTGVMGEDNLVSLTGEELSGNDNILNGPDGSPDAVGPTDDDDDYTNSAIDVEDIGVTPAAFVNTVANPATNTSQIDNVTLVPIDPATAAANDDDAATDPTKYGNPADIPDGTTVTISYDPTPGAPTSGDELSATYAWDDANDLWALTSGTPVNVGTLQPGEQLDYNVSVDFPGTAPAEGDVIPVAIVAFPDTGAAGYDGETVNNMTLDRIHIGFMSVTKEARILDETGTLVEDWTQTPTQNAEPGYIIEYRLTYENTSDPVTGSGNVGLTARDFRLVEDGDNSDDSGGASGTNNWHTDQPNEAPVTVHLNGTSVSTGTVSYYQEFTEDNTANDDLIGTTDPADSATVEAYVNEIGDVAPGGSGTMIFRRLVQDAVNGG